jgi:uncharacterized membrane protein YgcG
MEEVTTQQLEDDLENIEALNQEQIAVQVVESGMQTSFEVVV